MKLLVLICMVAIAACSISDLPRLAINPQNATNPNVAGAEPDNRPQNATKPNVGSAKPDKRPQNATMPKVVSAKPYSRPQAVPKPIVVSPKNDKSPKARRNGEGDAKPKVGVDPILGNFPGVKSVADESLLDYEHSKINIFIRTYIPQVIQLKLIGYTEQIVAGVKYIYIYDSAEKPGTKTTYIQALSVPWEKSIKAKKVENYEVQSTSSKKQTPNPKLKVASPTPPIKQKQPSVSAPASVPTSTSEPKNLSLSIPN